MLLLTVILLLGGIVTYYIIGFLAVAANDRLGHGAAMSVLGCAVFMLQLVVALIVTLTAYYSFSHLTGICVGIISIIVVLRNTWKVFQ